RLPFRHRADGSVSLERSIGRRVESSPIRPSGLEPSYHLLRTCQEVAIMHRRRFVADSASGLAGLLAAGAGLPLPRVPGAGRAREVGAEVVIVGGGLGGCAAALAALRNGRTVVLTEPTDWIGGQLTQQAVPPDEHPWIERFGGNASYAALRRGI